MAASAEIYFEHDRWGRALAWSLGLHVGITLSCLVYSAVFTAIEWRHLGRGRRRRGYRRHAGEHGSASGATFADTKCAGERVQGHYPIAAQDRREGTGRDRDSRQEREDQT